jgi:hypothetical protein
MLATQDVQAPTVGAEAAEEVKQLLHQVDLLLVCASQAAARFASTNDYDRQGYASPIDWIRFTCHQTSTVAADLIAVGEKLERGAGEYPGAFQRGDRLRSSQGYGPYGECSWPQIR